MPKDPRVSMWEDACELLDRAERLHRQFFRRPPFPSRRPAWEAPADVYETADALHILVALPGVAASQVQVALDTGTLIVRGRRPLPEEARHGHIRRLEIPHGVFERHIELPQGHYELRQRELRNGCLVLVLGKLT